VEITSSDQLLPYLEHVARRPYNHGLNACWDLRRGERVMLRVDNWHSPLTIEACQRILEKYGVKYTIRHIDRGPVPQWIGVDEVDYYLFRTRELAEWMDMWEEEEKKQEFDKILMGYGGPVLAERFIRIQRMPFITPEVLASPAHAMPIEVLNAIDRWTWDRIRSAKRAHHRSGRHGHISFTNHDDYWDADRQFHNPDLHVRARRRQRTDHPGWPSAGARRSGHVARRVVEPGRGGAEHGWRLPGPLRPRPVALGQDRVGSLSQLSPDVHENDRGG
jgi:hypothetical protein